MQPTNLDRIGFDIQTEFLAGRHHGVEKKAIEVKTVAIAALVIAAVVGVIFTVLACSLLPASFGFSSIFFIPAALAFAAVHDLYRLIRCCDIVAERAHARDNPLKATIQKGRDIFDYLTTQKAAWVRDIQKEIDTTILVRPLAYQRAPHHIQVW